MEPSTFWTLIPNHPVPPIKKTFYFEVELPAFATLGYLDPQTAEPKPFDEEAVEAVEAGILDENTLQYAYLVIERDGDIIQ
ncbi:hypothetical protein ABW20_dc0101066 [Dactylellina cionopaga]|nr:hypothetical protein ABW20_dc0101066 [Dactylellina cionopaga]